MKIQCMLYVLLLWYMREGAASIDFDDVLPLVGFGSPYFWPAQYFLLL